MNNDIVLKKEDIDKNLLGVLHRLYTFQNFTLAEALVVKCFCEMIEKSIKGMAELGSDSIVGIPPLEANTVRRLNWAPFELDTLKKLVPNLF